jgi:catechol 2,3-dioxygenase-like lactoylglutathione lyase family enzyme
MTNSKPLFTGVAFIVLRVRDIDETIRFYTENFGFYLLRKYIMEPGGPPCCYLGLNDVLLECISVPPDAEIPRVSFGLTVSDLDAAMAHVRSRGIEVVREQFTPVRSGDARPASRTPAATASPCGSGALRTALNSWIGSPPSKARQGLPSRVLKITKTALRHTQGERISDTVRAEFVEAQ